jgi:uncharacterized protein YqeY
MLRDRIRAELKEAMRAKDTRAISTLRLIVAALKDRDIAARGGAGDDSGISDDEILGMLQTMVRQRRDSIELYEKGGRLELAEREAEEIAIIERFLPEQLDEAAMREAIGATVAELGVSGLKDMGKVMGALRERYAGQMDFGKASAIVKETLAAT